MGSPATSRCTPTDLLHLAQAIQAAVAGDDGALLPADLARQMMTCHVADWGLGLKIAGDGDNRYFNHTGGNFGYVCGMVGTADGKNAAAVMTNSDQGVPVMEAMAAAVTASSSWQIN